MIDRQRRNELLRKFVAAVALVACLGIGVALVSSIFTGRPQQADSTHTTPTSRPHAPPVENIRPIPVRPVQELLNPDQCPPEGQTPPPVVPTEVLITCDFVREYAYVLGPQAMELQLTHVETRKSPTSEFHVVKVMMQPSSETAFATYTAGHVGEQAAFVRDGIVVFAPKITEALPPGPLEISSELTAEQAAEVLRLLRQPA